MEKTNEIFVEKLVDFEKAFVELFRELRLKPNQSEIIRALLIVSNGEIEFEASKNDLAKVLFKTDGKYDKTLNSRIGSWLKSLDKWQRGNELTLVEVVEPGGKDKRKVGREAYYKTKYKFVFLGELAKAYSQESDNLESVIQDLVAHLRENFAPVKEKRKYHPNHNIRKAKNTIFTYLKKIFQLAIDADDSPYHRCSDVLDECREILNNLGNEYTANKHRENFITEFEKKFDKSVMGISNENRLIG